MGQELPETAAESEPDATGPASPLGGTQPEPPPAPGSASAEPSALPQQTPAPEPESAPSPAAEEPDGDLFGANLEPFLQNACDGRLSSIRWFRTDWQRGGALTGYASYESESDGAHPVVVKLPVPPRERYWLTQLQGELDVVPRVYAHGEHLNGYDLAWVVMEALPHGPLSPDWAGAEFDLLVEAAGRFYAATEAVASPTDASRVDRDWHRLLELAQKQVHHGAVPEAKAWKTALKKAGKKLDQWVDRWQQRPVEQWCHGDLHLANAMTRQPPPNGPAVMLDLAQVRPGHWVEDAVYFEHLYWSAPDRLDGRKLVKQLADERKRLDLALDSDWAEYAQLKRALLAMAAPARLNQEGTPRHLAACLAVLQRHVK
jgi:hypothetical protein